MQAISGTYNDKVVRQFAITTVVWGIVGMLVGVIIAAQMYWPTLFEGIPWLGYGRLRPLHTNAVIFAFSYSSAPLPSGGSSTSTWPTGSTAASSSPWRCCTSSTMAASSIYTGAVDAMAQWWYGHNAVGFFLTAGFLGMMYYFVPKQAGRPIYF